MVMFQVIIQGTIHVNVYNMHELITQNQDELMEYENGNVIKYHDSTASITSIHTDTDTTQKPHRKQTNLISNCRTRTIHDDSIDQHGKMVC